MLGALVLGSFSMACIFLTVTLTVRRIGKQLRGLFASETLTKRLLLNNGKDPERMLQSESLLRALVVSYESDLPILQRHLVKLDEKAQGKSLIIAETRRLLLQVRICTNAGSCRLLLDFVLGC